MQVHTCVAFPPESMEPGTEPGIAGPSGFVYRALGWGQKPRATPLRLEEAEPQLAEAELVAVYDAHGDMRPQRLPIEHGVIRAHQVFDVPALGLMQQPAVAA